jgi:hypothetical protein
MLFVALAKSLVLILPSHPVKTMEGPQEAVKTTNGVSQNTIVEEETLVDLSTPQKMVCVFFALCPAQCLTRITPNPRVTRLPLSQGRRNSLNSRLRCQGPKSNTIANDGSSNNSLGQIWKRRRRRGRATTTTTTTTAAAAATTRPASVFSSQTNIRREGGR